jgi:hypothetical protein
MDEKMNYQVMVQTVAGKRRDPFEFFTETADETNEPGSETGSENTATTEEERVKGITTAEKTCVDCKQNYQPTSNVQKRCPGCGQKHKDAKKNANKSAGGGVPVKSSPRACSTEAPAPPLIDHLIAEFDKHTAKAAAIKTALTIIADNTDIEIPIRCYDVPKLTLVS